MLFRKGQGKLTLQMYPECSACGLHQHCNRPLLPGFGNSSPKLIIIGEAPSVDEDKDPSGVSQGSKLLSKLLGVKEKDVYYTNLVRCCPYDDPITKSPYTRPPTNQEINQCKNILYRELKMFNENTPIMTLGNNVLAGLVGQNAGITKELGISRKVKLGHKEFNVIPNYHPNAIINNVHLLSSFQRVIEKAYNNDPEDHRLDSLPKYKLLNFQESIDSINEVIQLYKDGKIPWIVFDIETTSLQPWTGSSIMYSITHELTHHSLVVPSFVNNNIDLLHIREFAETYDKEIEENRIFAEANPGHKSIQSVDNILKNLTDTVGRFFIDKHTVPFSIDPGQQAKIDNAIKILLETVPIIGHNIKFDLKFLFVKLGLNLDKVRVFADTLIMAHQVYGRTFGSSLSLKELSRKAFNVLEDWEFEIQYYLSKYRLLKDRHYGNIPTSILSLYAGLDTFYTKKLYHILAGSMQPGLVAITAEVTRATIPYVELESKGVHVDNDMLSYLGTSYKGAMSDINNNVREFPVIKKYISDKLVGIMEENSKKRKPRQLWDMMNDAFSMTSIPTLKNVFYGKDYYSLPVLDDFKTPKGEPQTGADVIKELIKNHAKGESLEFLKNLDDYKTFSKIVSTYIDGLPENIFDGSYKPDFSLTSTITGRLSSGFHVLPSKSDVKRIFDSRWRSIGGLFIAADQSQLELRVAASLANESKMIQAFKDGVDAHTATAAVVYKIDVKDVTDKQRKIGKIVNFAILFGKVAWTLAPDLGCSVDEAQAILDGFFEGRPGLKKFIEGQHNFVMEYGFVITATGRIIPVPDAFSNDKGHINHAKRCSVNYVVQSPASDIVLTSGNEIYYEMKGNQMKSAFIGSVHDFLGYDCYPGELFKMLKLIKYHCEEGVTVKYPWVTCPLVMDISIGASWGGAIEFKIQELTDNRVVLTGSALAKDFKQFKSVAEKAYKVDLTVLEKQSVPNEKIKFAKDIFFKDREFWGCKVVLSK